MENIHELINQVLSLKKELEQLKAQAVPIGAVEAFAMKDAPSGWLVCDGGMYSSELYPLLSKALGATYNQPDTPEGFFCVPDLQGQFIRGWDKDGNVDPEREFGSIQKDAIQGHKHKSYQSETDFAGDHWHTFKYHPEEMKSGTFGNSFRVVCHEPGDESWMAVNTIGNHKHKVTDVNIGEVESSAYGSIEDRVSTESRPKNMALLYCIKAN